MTVWDWVRIGIGLIFLITYVVLMILKNRRPPICLSCELLYRYAPHPGGSCYKYLCRGGSAFGVNSFDKPPEYCREYKQRKEGDQNE